MAYLSLTIDIGIRSVPNTDYPRNTSGSDGPYIGLNSAILRYQGAPDAYPQSNPLTPVVPLVETSLHVCLLALAFWGLMLLWLWAWLVCYSLCLNLVQCGCY